MHIEIEWDSEKAASNLRKHGVSFDEAATALLDPAALAQEDSAARGTSLDLDWAEREGPSFDGRLHVAPCRSNSAHLGTQGHA
jgi:hypothetical protein